MTKDELQDLKETASTASQEDIWASFEFLLDLIEKQAKVINAAKDVVFYYGGDKLSPIQNLKQALKELEE